MMPKSLVLLAELKCPSLRLGFRPKTEGTDEGKNGEGLRIQEVRHSHRKPQHRVLWAQHTVRTRVNGRYYCCFRLCPARNWQLKRKPSLVPVPSSSGLARSHYPALLSRTGAVMRNDSRGENTGLQ